MFQILFISSYNEEDIVMNQQLHGDIENLIGLYGDKAVQYRLIKYKDEIDVQLRIPLGFLDDVTTEAWNLLRSEPLVVSLHLSLSRYLESPNRPKIEVFQPSKKKGLGFNCLHMRKIIENFIYTELHQLKRDNQKCLEEVKTIEKSQMSPTVSKSEIATTEIISEICKNEIVEELVNLGFEADLARKALIITHGNIDEAASLLVDNSHKFTEENILNKTAVDITSVEKLSKFDSQPLVAVSKQTEYRSSQIFQMVDDKNISKLRGLDLYHNRRYKLKAVEEGRDTTAIKVEVGIKRQSSHPLKTTKVMVSEMTRNAGMMSEHIDSHMPEDLELIPPLTNYGTNAKTVPSNADGFLVQVFRYVRQRIPTMNEYCVICDEPHVFQNGAMLKPAVCSRELCVFAFQTLGVMADAAEDIATGAEVVDLLINMTRSASKSGRKNLIFDPFPTVVDPKDPCNLLFTPKNPDYDLAESVIDAIPPMTQMVCMTSSLKQNLDANNPSVYPLIQWIITSNRSHIVKLPPAKQLDFMNTPHQFLLLSSPPAKEAAFQEAKKKFGSLFAFHGSSIENWHSIIRQGLMNASGTKLQMNGASHGNGIYLSSRVSTSMLYSSMGFGSRDIKQNNTPVDGKSRFLVSSNITCIALCEVITTPLKMYSSIWVCPVPDHVCTRFFFVYEDGQVGDSSIDTQHPTYLEQIKAACGYKM